MGTVWRHIRVISSACLFGNFAEGLLHVTRHFDFVLTPLPVKPQYRNSPFINGIRINLAIALLVRDHFAPACEANVGSVGCAATLLQARTIAFVKFAKRMKLAYPGQCPATAKFDVITTQKFILAIELPPWHVHVHAANAVVVVRRHFGELRRNTSAATADAVGEVTPNASGRLPQ